MLNNPNFPSYQSGVSVEVISEAKKLKDLERKFNELKDAISSITNGLDSVTIKSGEVEITNFDEVKLHLRSELSLLLKPIVNAISGIKFPEFPEIPKPLSEIKITNLCEIEKAESVSVSNLSDLYECFEELAESIKGCMNVVIPEPIVNVSVPTQLPPIVNVPEIDFSPLLRMLDPLKYLSDRADKPIAVRMSDGHKFMKAVKQIVDAQDKMAFAVSNSTGMDKGDFQTAIRTVDDILAQYRVVDKDDDASPNYYGFVDSIGNWYILKETVSAGADTYRYCKGGSDYSTNWTNRASLTYDYFDLVF